MGAPWVWGWGLVYGHVAGGWTLGLEVLWMESRPWVGQMSCGCSIKTGGRAVGLEQCLGPWGGDWVLGVEPGPWGIGLAAKLRWGGLGAGCSG